MVITVQKLKKNYYQSPIINTVSFGATHGEIIGLIGKTGSGKTTLCRLIAGFLIPDEGRITISGFNVVRNPIRARTKIGYIPQKIYFPPISVKDYLHYRAILKRIRRYYISEYIQNIISICQLEIIIDKMIPVLTREEIESLRLADALLSKPDLIILDHPLIEYWPDNFNLNNLFKTILPYSAALITAESRENLAKICTKFFYLSDGKIVSEKKLPSYEEKFEKK